MLDLSLNDFGNLAKPIDSLFVMCCLQLFTLPTAAIIFDAVFDKLRCKHL